MFVYNYRLQELTTDMIGMGTPKMDGSVQPNSLLLQHEGETRARIKSFTVSLKYNCRSSEMKNDKDH